MRKKRWLILLHTGRRDFLPLQYFLLFQFLLRKRKKNKTKQNKNKQTKKKKNIVNRSRRFKENDWENWRLGREWQDKRQEKPLWRGKAVIITRLRTKILSLRIWVWEFKITMNNILNAPMEKVGNKQEQMMNISRGMAIPRQNQKIRLEIIIFKTHFTRN